MNTLHTTPTTVPAARRAPARRPLHVLLVAALVAVLALLVAAQPATAAVAQNVEGRPGAVSTNGPLITGRDAIYDVYGGESYYTRTFATAGVTVAPSGAYAGWQRVSGQYALERWVNGAWQNVQRSGTYSGTVSGTGRLTFPYMKFGNPPQYRGRWPWRIRVTLVWQNYNTGAYLGGENIVPSTYADNQCATRYISCQSYTDSIVM